jgi:RNA polymerase sigma-70 factor (ECF subfamily)
MFTHQELLAEQIRLKKFAIRLTGNISDADDLLQSTYLHALKKDTTFETGTNLFSWSSRIMYNIFVSGYRRRVKFESNGDPDIHMNKLWVLPAQDINSQIVDVDKAMKQLHHDHYEILVMVCIKEMSYHEVSAMLDIPVGTVRSRLSRAREHLQTILNREARSPHKTIQDTIIKQRLRA